MIAPLCGEIGITGLHSIWNWDYGITPHLKLGLWDYTPFEIGIMGLQDSPYGGPTNLCAFSHSTLHQWCVNRNPIRIQIQGLLVESRFGCRPQKLHISWIRIRIRIRGVWIWIPIWDVQIRTSLLHALHQQVCAVLHTPLYMGRLSYVGSKGWSIFAYGFLNSFKERNFRTSWPHEHVHFQFAGGSCDGVADCQLTGQGEDEDELAWCQWSCQCNADCSYLMLGKTNPLKSPVHRPASFEICEVDIM